MTSEWMTDDEVAYACDHGIDIEWREPGAASAARDGWLMGLPMVAVALFAVVAIL